MSPTLSIILAAVVLANILGCLWLLLGSSNSNNGNEDEENHVWDEDIHELNNPMPNWWRWMFVISIVVGLGYLVLYPGLGSWSGTLGWSEKGELEARINQLTEKRQQQFTALATLPLEEIANNADAKAHGASLFSQYCAGCHGAGAQGAIGFPNLADDDWLYGGEAETILASIADGRKGAMPAFKAMLNEADIDTVAAYIQQWPENPTAGAEQHGQQLFQTRCSFCHGQQGEGNPVMGAARLNDDIWLYGGSRENIVASISNGRAGEMPAHKNLMSAEELRLVAAWVYGLSKSSP